MTAGSKSITWFLCFFVLLFALTADSFSQELRGRVQGIVADSTGAIVPGASVKLRNDNTGIEVEKVTSDIGQFRFDFLDPGTYTLTAELPGFQTFVQRNIRVQTRGDVTVNVTLQIGEVTETVTVAESPAAVQFNTATMEVTLDTKMSQELPIVHRNPFLLATLNPAVIVRSSTEQSPYHHWAASQLDVGGDTSTKNDILIDGVPQLVGAKGTYVPNMDAVSEVNVQQNAVDAEYGHSAGGIISVGMKSGTNDWHGTAYYFGRNPALNAVADSRTHSPNLVRNHTWGISSGNPIVRNKVFNFISYEGALLKEPRTITATVPTQLERTGDFSQTLNRDGGLRTIYDPLTTVFDPETNTATRQPFPNNIIPASRIDPTAARFMQDIWLPNRPGNPFTGANNYGVTFGQSFDYWNLSNRTDWNINDNLKVFGRLSRFHTLQSDPNVTGSPAEQVAGSERNTIQTSGDVVWTIDPTMVVNIRGSWSKITDSFEAESAKIGEEGLAQFWPGNPWYQSYLEELPAIYYPGLDVRGETRTRFGRDGFWFQEPSTWNMQGKVSKQIGRHFLKVGGEFRHQRVLAARPRPMGFRFDKDPTADTFLRPDTRRSGDAYATMLLGIVHPDSRIQTVAMNRPRIDFWAFYVHDDFKISPQWTINVGLRWEFETALRDPELRLSRFLDLTDPIPEFQGAGAPVFPSEALALGAQPIFNGAWFFTDADDRGTWNAPRDIFLPRVGLAYRINDRSALRIGYARYVVHPIIARDAGVAILGSTPYPGFNQTTNPLPPLEGVPQAFLGDPYPANENPLIPPPGKSLGRYTNLGDSTEWFNQNWINETNDRINVTFQTETVGRFVVDLTYFLSVGRNRPIAINHNLMDPRLEFTHQGLLSQQVDNPFFQILTPEQFPGGLRQRSRVPLRDLLRPYPQYGNLIERNGLEGASSLYNSFQLKVQRPFADGFNFLVGYNHNRFRTEEFYDDVDHFDRQLIWQRNDQPRNKFTLAGIYELPFGRGRRFMQQANPVAEAILGGWSLTGIYEYLGGDFLIFGGMEQVGDPLAVPNDEYRFNPDAFVRLAPFTRRQNPWTIDGVHGPSFSNLDLTLAKEHAVSEEVTLEFRMEAYNLTNSFMGANPSMDVTSSVFGQVVDQRNGFKGRQFQYSLRMRW